MCVSGLYQNPTVSPVKYNMATSTEDKKVIILSAVKDPDYPSLLLAGSEELYRDGKVCDITVHTSDKQQFFCHRNIMYAMCKNLIANGQIEKCELQVDQSSNILESFINFLYTGRLDITRNNVEGLKSLGDKLGCESVLTFCKMFHIEHGEDAEEKDSHFHRVYSYPDYGKDVLLSIQFLQNHRQHQDITIEVQSNTFMCHKQVLAAVSPYFSAMLAGNFIERGTDFLKFDDISSDAFEVLLEFLYSGRLNLNLLSTDVVSDVYKLADMVLLDYCFIQNACEKYMIENLSFETYVQYKNHGQLYQMASLINTAEHFVLKHFTSLLDSCHADTLSSLSLEEFSDLLSDDRLHCHSEIDVFHVVCKWLENIPEHKGNEHILMQHVRFYWMSDHELKEVLNTKLMTSNESCMQLVPNNDQKKGSFFQKHFKRDKGIVLRPQPRGLLSIVWFWTDDYKGKTNMLAFPLNQTGHQHISPATMAALPLSIEDSTVIAKDNLLYLIGGALTASKQATALVYRYNSFSNKWKEMTPLHIPRKVAAAGIVNDKIFVIGGKGRKTRDTREFFSMLSSVECFNMETNKWKHKQDFPCGIYSHACCVLEDTLYLSGGLTCMAGSLVSSLSDKLYSYDHLADEWQYKTTMQVPHYYHLMCAVGKCLYIFGDASVECYDTLSEQMSVVCETSFPSRPRHLPRVAVSIGNEIFLCGYCNKQESSQHCGKNEDIDPQVLEDIEGVDDHGYIVSYGYGKTCCGERDLMDMLHAYDTSRATWRHVHQDMLCKKNAKQFEKRTNFAVPLTVPWAILQQGD